MFFFASRREIERAIEEGGEVHLFHGKRRDLRAQVRPQDFSRTYQDPETYPGNRKAIIVEIQNAFPLVRFGLQVRQSAFGDDPRYQYQELYLIFEKGARHDGPEETRTKVDDANTPLQGDAVREDALLLGEEPSGSGSPFTNGVENSLP